MLQWKGSLKRLFYSISEHNELSGINRSSAPHHTHTLNNDLFFKHQLPLKGEFSFHPWLNGEVRFAFVGHWGTNDGKLELTMCSDYSYNTQYSPNVTNHVYSTREREGGTRDSLGFIGVCCTVKEPFYYSALILTYFISLLRIRFSYAKYYLNAY